MHYYFFVQLLLQFKYLLAIIFRFFTKNIIIIVKQHDFYKKISNIRKKYLFKILYEKYLKQIQKINFFFNLKKDLNN